MDKKTANFLYNGMVLKKTIGKLEREITISVETWGLYALVTDKTPNSSGLSHFSDRRFNLCNKYPTYESNIARIKKYYKIAD